MYFPYSSGGSDLFESYWLWIILLTLVTSWEGDENVVDSTGGKPDRKRQRRDSWDEDYDRGKVRTFLLPIWNKWINVWYFQNLCKCCLKDVGVFFPLLTATLDFLFYRGSLTPSSGGGGRGEDDQGVTALDSRPWLGHCVMFLVKKPDSCIASLHPQI